MDDPLLRDQTFHSLVAHAAWDYKATLAFWCTCMTIEGAILFAVGSLMMFPGMKPTDEEHEYVARAWIEYSFMIGGWCFTFGNYLSYLNVINQNKNHEKEKRWHLITWPEGQMDKGHVASLLNVVGALWYNIGTMSMFGWPPTDTMSMFDVTYVGTGVAGSLCFSVASLLEGEYNEWRKCKLTLPVLSSHLNFWGANLFLFGYAIDFNKTAESMGADSALQVYGVDNTFFVGSLCFLAAAWMDLFMWQQERYGLGFANKLQNYSEARADMRQLLSIAVIIINICCAWIRLSFAVTSPESVVMEGGLQWSVAEKILAYHGILILLSVLHKVPDRHPYDYLTYCLRFLAAFGLVCECVELRMLILRYSK